MDPINPHPNQDLRNKGQEKRDYRRRRRRRRYLVEIPIQDRGFVSVSAFNDTAAHGFVGAAGKEEEVEEEEE